MQKTLSARLLAALTVGGLLLGMGACSNRAEVQEKTPTSAQASTPAGPITVVDQRGKTVTLKQPAQRIATTVIPSPAIIAAVDGSFDRIVGINESTLKANKQGLIGKIYPQSTTTQTIANSDFKPNMETVLALKPDVAVQWADIGGAEIIKPLEDAGIPTVGLKYGTQEDLETWVQLFGKIIGKDDRAKTIVDNMHKVAADVKKQVEGLGKEPTRALIMSVTPSGFTSGNKSSYDNYLFGLAGGNQVSAENTAANNAINVEQLLAWDPEVILLSAFDESTPADIYNNPNLASLTAVKEKRVYKTPLGVYRWQVPCAESPLMWNWTAALLHPESYKVDLRKMMREQIKFLYNYELTDEDIDQTLRMDLNSDSANYQNLFAK